MNNYSGSAAAAAHSDFLSLSQLRRKDLQALLGLSVELRSKTMFAQALQGKSVAMIFEKLETLIPWSPLVSAKSDGGGDSWNQSSP